MEQKTHPLAWLQHTALAAGLTVVLIVALTVIAELAPGFKDWLKQVFSHHWVGKGVLAAVGFVSFSVLFRLLPLKVTDQTVTTSLRALSLMAILASVVVYGFFLFES